HCTGEPTFTALKMAFGERYLYAGLGRAFALGATPSAVAGASHDGSDSMDGSDLVSYRTLLASSHDDEHPTVAEAR
ncbi:hypothetical protein, partial [Methylibium sp.]|uniref:hypothetical protein n=1 Tax=Methylibium sp. TaxID=2067992 RepID=UPI00286AF5F5